MSDLIHYDAVGNPIYLGCKIKRIKPFPSRGYLNSRFRELGVVLEVIDFSSNTIDPIPIQATLRGATLTQWVEPESFLVL